MTGDLADWDNQLVPNLDFYAADADWLAVVEAVFELGLFRRIDLLAEAPGDPTFRHCCEGWGLVQLHYGGPFGAQELRWSHTNHNSEKRAAAWAATVPRLGDPAAWDWPAVSRASGRLNRVIRRMAVSRIGAHPVLPHAGRLIADAGLRYEYGTGVHATPSHG
ncbi:hypothetical protein ACQP0I_12305 [Micromonospora carbonacea]|uniref:hypothetical protein n=1 Tax=Micromonospora carbonacea TaxID=47853 RepID=UPI003D96BDC3